MYEWGSRVFETKCYAALALHSITYIKLEIRKKIGRLISCPILQSECAKVSCNGIWVFMTAKMKH